jgi:Flp pilus assembly secretin CpaC
VVPGSGSVLRYIPIFGSLFGSRNFQSKKTQLLVIMRPQVTQGDR